MTSIILWMDLFGVESGVDDLSAVVCPDCCRPLTLHQPDERLPDRLIGTCDTCPSWFLIETASARIARLPEAGAVPAR